MAVVEDLVRSIAQAVTGGLVIEISGRQIDLATPFERSTMFEIIGQATGRDLMAIWNDGDAAALSTAATELGVRIDERWSRGKVLAEIFEQTSEKTLIAPTFVTGFPTDVSPLAKDHRSIPGFTEHADLILGGLEIAPIYSELNDPTEQRRRFEQQAEAREAGDDEATVKDEEFLEALAYGMPPAGGFGLGIDRLLMLLLQADSIREVVLFPTLRPEAT